MDTLLEVEVEQHHLLMEVDQNSSSIWWGEIHQSVLGPRVNTRIQCRNYSFLDNYM